ncbi:polyprenyl diphosphate synthase [Alphaproteobacteria bacterium]|nr:polyprenyl diphosphate synthase [Alphaproteobacteria bacterium]
MDGNNRWSKKNNYKLYDSYIRGSKKLLSLSNYIFSNYEISYITSFALSKNNLNRPTQKVLTLIKVLENFINDRNNSLNQYKFNISIIGNLSFLNKQLKKKIIEFNSENKNYSKSLIILLNYSGQGEILDTVKQLIKSKKKINQYNFEKNLLLNDIPYPDMLIRTGGYNRLSNFMLYQLAFTDFFFTKKLWPDISNKDVDKFIDDYHKIDRKFGL